MIPVLPLLLSAGSAVGKVLRSVPWQFYALAAAVAACWWYGEARADQREREVRAEIRDQLDREAWQQDAYEDEQREKDAAATGKVVTVYVDRIKTVYQTGATIIKEVPVYVPVDSPDLPAGFRVLHDAAAAGSVPSPASIPDAAPVAAQAVAETVVDNYTACHANTALLTAYQKWWAERSQSP